MGTQATPAPSIAGNAGERMQRVEARQRLRRVAERQVQLREVGQEGGPGGGAGGGVVLLGELQGGDGGRDGRRSEPVERLRAADLLPVLCRGVNQAERRAAT